MEKRAKILNSISSTKKVEYFFCKKQFYFITIRHTLGNDLKYQPEEGRIIN